MDTIECGAMSIILCRPRTLPVEKLVDAERRAIEINPENALEHRLVERTPIGRRGGPRRIAVVIARKWPASGVRLTVQFLDNPSTALRSRILLHMNAWGEHANVLFTETGGVGQVRIARFDAPDEVAGYWSWVGTEILEIDESEPTMNLDSFTMSTAESEFRRVIRHEAGHTLGFDHEHMRSDIVSRIDRKKAIAFYDKDQGWSPKEVEEQVLTPLAKKSIMGTKESDPLSIMCYHLPGKIMKDGKAVTGGKDINTNDFAFAKELYPKPERARKERAAKDTAPPPPPDEETNETFELVVMSEFKSRSQQPHEKPKLAQVFATYGGARVTSTLRLRDDDDEKTLFDEIIDVHERIKAYTNREQGSLPDDEEMITFGSQLFDTLFQGDVRRLYDEARTRQGKRLDLVLTSMIPWIAEKPWEFAYDHGRRSFLATEEIHFVRNVLTNVPADPIAKHDGPLRILVASAQPVGFGRLSIDQEVAVIQRGFEPLAQAGLVEIKALARVTPSMIHDELKSGRYQVVHFIGHGVFDEKRGEGCLVFVNENGNEHRLGERSVREIFSGRGLSLVFLNSCESGRGGRSDFNKGVAQSLVAHGLPALVANQYSVLDSSATSFAQQFYSSLAQGLSLGQAAREARIAVNYLLRGEPIDWAVPVLYARDANATICTPGKKSVTVRTTSVSASSRRSTQDHVSRIAVWDMDNVFPKLDQTLMAMNQAQSQFGFELTDLSVPLGVWDLNTKRGTAYLRADHLANRLERMPMELGVDVLACVTRHWMRDEEWLDLYNWWSGKTPIVVFSIAGFDELPSEGPETSRAIANNMVSALAGIYGDIEAHQGGSKNCPLWFDQERKYETLVSQQKFDARCRQKLKSKLGKNQRLAALESLLKVF